MRDRKNVLPALVDHFIGLKTEELKLPQITVPAPGALETLTRYDCKYQGTGQCVELSIILSSDGLLHFHLEGIDPEAFEETGFPGSPFFDSLQSDNFPTLDQTAARLIQRVFELTGGKIRRPQGAGELLGGNPNTLRHRMWKLRIDFGRNSGWRYGILKDSVAPEKPLGGVGIILSQHPRSILLLSFSGKQEQGSTGVL